MDMRFQGTRKMKEARSSSNPRKRQEDQKLKGPRSSPALCSRRTALVLLAVLLPPVLAFLWPASCPTSSRSLGPLAKAWKARGQYFLHQDQHLIFYIDESTPADNDTTLVLLHGFPTSSWDWHKMWPQLSRRFGRLVALDFLGFGFSDKPPTSYRFSILEQASIVEALLDHLQVSEAHFLVHDYGVTVAQELLSRFEERRLKTSLRSTSYSAPSASPLRISSVCFLNGGLFPETHKPILMQQLLLNEWARPFLSPFIGYHTFKRSFLSIFGPATKPSEKELQEIWGMLSLDGGEQLTGPLLHYMVERRIYRERWVGVLQRLGGPEESRRKEGEVPLYLINGPADPISGLHMAERYKELVPNPKVELLASHIGHFPLLEAPLETVEAYDRLRGRQS
ncbi:Mesoderm specific transcript [Balamuthia mandrillaris]